jgi:hypothetical protein
LSEINCDSKLNFDPADPFPLLDFQQFTYPQAKAHSEKVDFWLGFQMKAVEESIFQKHSQDSDSFPQERWSGLDVQSLLTPYLELRAALAQLEIHPGDWIVDLGCAYARLAHIIGRHFPQNYFLGYELVPERVQEALRVLKPFHYPLVQVLEKDLVISPPKDAAIYFVYDYGSNRAIEKTLNDLREISLRQKFQVVARGRASRALISQNHPWLGEVNEARHFQNFSIYRS